MSGPRPPGLPLFPALPPVPPVDCSGPITPEPPALPAPKTRRRRRGAVPVVGEAAEYHYGGEDWRVEDFAGLSAEFDGLSAEMLPDWHGVLVTHQRGWAMVARIYGVFPVILPVGADPDRCRPTSRRLVQEEMGVTAAQLRDELEILRRAWKAATAPPAGVPLPILPAERPPERPVPPPLTESDADILARYSFPQALWNDDGRLSASLATRVREWEPLLKDKIVSGHARAALLLEVRMHRLQEAVAEVDPAALDVNERKRGRQYSEDLSACTREYDQVVDRIAERAPWFNITGQAMDFRGAVTEIVDAIAEYRRDGSTRLVDGIFTMAEVQVMLRTSTQNPEPRYRVGWVAYVNAAREGLWDAAWQPQLKPGVLGKLDAGFKAAVREAVQDAGEPVPDLTREEDEYPDLATPENDGNP